VASDAVLVPVGDREAVTTEVRDIVPASQADLAPDESMDCDEVEVPILVRVEVKRGISVAARHLALIEAAGPVRAEAQVLAPVEVEECILDVARNLASVADVDSAPALDMAKVLPLAPVGGQVKTDQAEVRDQVAGRALALAVDVDSAPVAARTLAETESHGKMDQDEVGDRVAMRTPALAADMDSVQVPVRGRVMGSVPTDATVPAHLPRSSRNRKFR
jgi:hypothetical protein